jgi:hypothetical protein
MYPYLCISVLVFPFHAQEGRLGGGVLCLLCTYTTTIPVCSGPINMIPSAKLIFYVLPIHFACSIMQIGQLIAKAAEESLNLNILLLKIRGNMTFQDFL